MKDDIGPVIGFILIALVAFLILFSVGTNGRFYNLALNEMHKSFGSPTVTPQPGVSRIDEFKDWAGGIFSGQADTKPGSAAQFSCVTYKNPEIAELINVIDGDTVSVRFSDGSVKKVQYIGVNTAEEGTEYYQAGKDRNIELTSKSKGILTMYRDKSETDKYGRLLRYVFAGDTFVNYELVNSGVAEAMTIAPDTSCASLFEMTDHYFGRVIHRP